MDNQFTVRKGPIDEHPVEGDALDLRPFQVAPLLVCMCDWVNTLTEAGELEGIS